MVRALLIICPHESETQTGVVLTTSQCKPELMGDLTWEARGCLSAAWEWKIWEQQFLKKIQVWIF